MVFVGVTVRKVPENYLKLFKDELPMGHILHGFHSLIFK